jgi:hypothetical protein
MTTNIAPAGQLRPEPTVYGIARPTLAGTRAALATVSSGDVTSQWKALLARAGLTGSETDVESLQRLLATMTAAGGAVALCSRAQSIRLQCHIRLTAVHDMVHAG